MEIIIKRFFEHFESLERDSLHARYKRRNLVEYFNTLIEGCRSGLGAQCDVQQVIQQAIVGILRYHRKSRQDNGGVCIMGKYHNILYVAVKLCYDWQLQCTATVAALLDEIHTCEGTFERILVGALFGIRAPHYIAGWKSDFDDQEENVRAIVYFLDHATNAGLEYSNKYRFIDVPVESCGKASCVKILVQLGVPDKLLILLRYGALIDSDDDRNEETVFEIILSKLSEFNRQYPYNLVACLQLLLRCSTSVFLRCSITDLPEFIAAKYVKLIQDSILPVNRSGLVPAELKHLSRCAVRHQLWRNFQLPQGIKSLPVPEEMQRYIDIMVD